MNQLHGKRPARFDVRGYNARAWDKAVERESPWTVPVGPEVIEAARRGDWAIVLTPAKPVPHAWFPPLAGAAVLCLASGGGQQGPILAAAGARVTVFDNSPQQLAQDRYVARRDGLQITTVEGDMRALSMFPDASFDLIVHPVSNLFVPEVRPVWHEAHRVLRTGGVLLAGFCNPVIYLFDQELADKGVLRVRHKLPYSDLTSISEAERSLYTEELQPLEFGHSLEDQIGGQLDAGFVLTGFYEDIWPGTPLSEYMPTYIATRSVKLERTK
ncbi:MAG: class I SAM-dependent methyltransferase [Caldilineaceae bacterium]|nr:class I SAM-dependent methyltransferase [Caldilineaceae bacterium]